MDIVVTGRHVSVSDRFREHIEGKLEKVPQLAPRTRRIEVMVGHEANRRQAKACDRVEITCYVSGRVVRAESCQEDKYTALDVALDRLIQRLRRQNDRKRVSRGHRTPESVAQATARAAAGVDGAVGDLGDLAPPADRPEGSEQRADPFEDSPVEVREKVHRSRPMSLEQALLEMELVGHDFYLYHDAGTDSASVVYRRRGWSYGVLRLDLADADDEGERPGGAAAEAS